MIDSKTKEELIKSINSVVKNAIVVKPNEVSSMPSGSILIDLSLGVGGYPVGRITEIFGGESAGKSTIALTICAVAQGLDIIPTYVDVENAIDFNYAHLLGVDTNNWALAQPESAEDAFRIAEAAIRNGSKLVVLDSIGAMVANRETEAQSDIGDNQVGLMARLISKFVRRIAPIAHKENAVVIIINQKRAKIGAMPGTSTEDTPGGFALRHACSVRMKITRTGKESGEEPDFITSKTQVIKNKVAPPYRDSIIKIRFGAGIDLWSEVVQIGVKQKILKKSGSWYKYGSENIGQGEMGAISWLMENEKVLREILETLKPYRINVDYYMTRLSSINSVSAKKDMLDELFGDINDESDSGE